MHVLACRSLEQAAHRPKVLMIMGEQHGKQYVMQSALLCACLGCLLKRHSSPMPSNNCGQQSLSKHRRQGQISTCNLAASLHCFLWLLSPHMAALNCITLQFAMLCSLLHCRLGMRLQWLAVAAAGLGAATQADTRLCGGHPAAAGTGPAAASDAADAAGTPAVAATTAVRP